ncbi:MAG: glutamate racemase [Clostridiales bacterium]|nr:glutamate racemase [Clostridiales bacterium]
MDKRPIGIFDSGVGGLTVVKQVIKAMPGEDTVYFGDTARVPYGSKSKETVTEFSRQIMRFLLKQDVKAVIIACNTVSSNSYHDLEAEFNIPIIEVVSPGVESCLAVTKTNRVGVIGTAATIKSGAYEHRLKAARPEIQVFQKSCPLFVPLAEEGFTENDIAKLTVKTYLKELKDKNIDSLILGCTHYPMLKKTIGEYMGEEVKIVDPATETAHKMKDFLESRNMTSGKEKGSHIFYCSDNCSQFNMICNKNLGIQCRVHKENAERY